MNTPRFNPEINPDDPKWTAYVLGELDETERADIERLLENSEEARALVEELSLAATTLKDELAPLASPRLSAEQRNAVIAASEPAPSRWARIFHMGWGPGLAVAAMVLMAVAIPAWMALKPADYDPFEDPRGDLNVAVSLPAGNPTSSAPPATSSISRERLDPTVADRRSESEAAASNPTAAQNVTSPQPPIPRRERMAEVADAPVGTTAYRDVLDKVQAGISPDGEKDLAKLDLTEERQQALQQGQQGQQAQQGRQGQQLPQGQGMQGQQAPPADLLRAAAEVAPETLTPAAAGGRGGGVVGGTGAGVPGGVLGGVAQNAQLFAAAPPPPPPSPPPPPPPVGAIRADNVAPIVRNAEAYDRIVDNPFIRTSQENLATFSIDVDTASYANVRRFLNQNQLPPRDAVRIEEMINYFSYDYARPNGNTPIAPNMEVAAAPWNPANRLVRIGIKAREIANNRRPPSNLVFLIDVSGSMNAPNKLPLVKQGLKMLVDQLGENDTVSIVVYAGASGLVLPPTSATRKATINQSIDSLYPGGSTNGASGIQLAYNQAVANFIRGGVNRVILMTDGDFNVGITNQGALTRLIEDRAKSGVFLSVLGFGMGNIKDSTLEKLADQGNGNYAYIDSYNEARKVLVEEMGGTLVTVAKDVKIQVDFNPGQVEAYRLIGYENRVLRTEDFNNDLKDAGDMGAGHTVTALFEVVAKGGSVPGPSIDPSKYTRTEPLSDVARNVVPSNEMLTLRVRYKLPDESTSSRMDVSLVDRGGAFARASSDFRFAASVAGFGMILRDSPYRGNATFESVLDVAEGSRGADRNGYRAEFISLVQKARSLR